GGCFISGDYSTDEPIVDLDGDEDLFLPDENVQWDFGDGTTIRDAGGWDHEYAAPGDYTVRLSVLVAGTDYTSAQVVTIGDEEAPEEVVPVEHASRSATVFESATDELPNTSVAPDVEPNDDIEDDVYDPGAYTVDEVLAYANDHPDQVEDIIRAEESGKQRVGILDKL
ncbi:MAG: hypothetical protein K0S92_1626, partial [Desertimonas sp.]|nr:hypothetical protein [Desertimonas sp.]